MTDVKWIKLDTEIFSNPKINTIICEKGGRDVFAIWIFLLCLAGRSNANGKLTLTETIPINENYIAKHLNASPERIRKALNTMMKYEMICVQDGFIVIKNWEKYQNTEKLGKIREDTKKRVAKHRERISEPCGSGDM